MNLSRRPFIFMSYFGSVIHFSDKSVQYFASSGTLSMNPDGSCQVLAEEAIRLEDIDLAVSSYRFRFNFFGFNLLKSL